MCLPQAQLIKWSQYYKKKTEDPKATNKYPQKICTQSIAPAKLFRSYYGILPV